MAETDTRIQIGVELPVRLVIGDSIDEQVGTVTFEEGDTPDKVIAEFLYNVAKTVAEQTQMALEMIDAGLMTRVEVPADMTPQEWVEQHRTGLLPLPPEPNQLAMLTGEVCNCDGSCQG